MTRTSIVVLTAVLVAAATPAFASTECDTGFRSHMEKMSVYNSKVSGGDLAVSIRKSLGAYDACNAGDAISPKGVWDKIEADLKAKAGQ